jgi:hypothetical protein
MTFYLRRQNKRREREAATMKFKWARRGRRCTGNFLAIYGTLKRNGGSSRPTGRPPSLKSECFHSTPRHQYKFSNPLYALIMSIIKTPDAPALQSLRPTKEILRPKFEAGFMELAFGAHTGSNLLCTRDAFSQSDFSLSRCCYSKWDGKSSAPTA